MHRETLDKKNCEGEGKRKLIKNKKNLNENNEKFEKKSERELTRKCRSVECL